MIWQEKDSAGINAIELLYSLDNLPYKKRSFGVGKVSIKSTSKGLNRKKIFFI